MKEKKIATELVAVSIGPKAAQDSIRTALAMGVDKGIHIETNLRTDQELQPLAVAKLLKEVAKVRMRIALYCFVSDLFVCECESTERGCEACRSWKAIY